MPNKKKQTVEHGLPAALLVKGYKDAALNDRFIGETDIYELRIDEPTFVGVYKLSSVEVATPEIVLRPLKN